MTKTRKVATIIQVLFTANIALSDAASCAAAAAGSPASDTANGTMVFSRSRMVHIPPGIGPA